jgi:hypothetical protein
LSNIRAGTISGVNGTDPVTLTKQSAAKAFMLFNGYSGVNSIDVSLNISSVTDDGAGNYITNFSSAMDATDKYSVAICTNDLSWGAKQTEAGGNGGTTRTASRVDIRAFSGSGSSNNASDAQRSSLLIHGDLA